MDQQYIEEIRLLYHAILTPYIGGEWNGRSPMKTMRVIVSIYCMNELMAITGRRHHALDIMRYNQTKELFTKTIAGRHLWAYYYLITAYYLPYNKQ